MSSKSKRQQTMAKRTREQTVREKRAMKIEKKAAVVAARLAGITVETEVDENGAELAAEPSEAQEPAEAPAGA